MSWAQFEDTAEAKGYAQISNALLRSPRVSLQAKSVYALLKSYAWQDANTYPGVGTLCDAAGVSKDTLGKYLKELIAVGLIKVKRRGQGNTNLYTFLSVSRFLEGEMTSGPDGDTGSHQDGDTGSHNEDSVNEDSVDKSTDSSEDAKTESLSNYHMKRIYDAMKKANYTITGKSKNGGENEYGKLVGRVQWMLDNMSPTDDELEGLPEAYVQAYTIRGAATDAVYALNELRRQKARDELISETKPAAWEPVNPHGEAGTKARSKARKPVWYASCYPVSEEMAQQWVDDGLSHDDILAILAKPAGDRIAS